jgi:type I restriction-modification system DNA methylase subunit
MRTTAFEEAFEKVKSLAANFQAHEARYLATDYQEAEARKDFIDKLFEALGWDVSHDEQHNPYEQEVKVEPSVAEGSARKRADYAFFLAPNFHDVNFFVEAKKPSSDLGNADSIFQTARYGWSSRTPIAALTNFDRFYVLDCRREPNINDTLSRIALRFNREDYADKEKFARLYYLFAREAVANRSLVKFADGLPRVKTTGYRRGLFTSRGGAMDETFLEELDDYRSKLAKVFKEQHPKLTSAALTEMTQRTLDRLVFTRFLEDKLIEPTAHVEKFAKSDTPWKDFIERSVLLNRTYNGIVYKPHELLDNERFLTDDHVFQKICAGLGDPTSPYNFNHIPIPILGSIYERFLGNVISDAGRLTEKPEVRKAGGVYYTPEYIVRYIVEQTVGKLIADKTPKQIAEMKFADIACGSGSFLLGVYDTLLRYHSKYYNDKPATMRPGDCVRQDDGSWHLTLAKKRDILVNNIYGVDLDAQAVEVCQLSLYLKLLEEETTASARQFLLDFEHRTEMKQLLPDLSKNIVRGNSLIGRDITQTQKLTPDEEKKLCPMDFESRFPQIFGRKPGLVREPAAPYGLGHEGGRRWYPAPPEETHGFDAIVGNPPYGGRLSRGETDYFHGHYNFQDYQLDTYLLFLERAISLVKHDGDVGLIIPNTWLLNLQSPRIREHIFAKTEVQNIVHYRDRVFPKVTVDTEVAIFRKSDPSDEHVVRITVVDKVAGTQRYEIPQLWWRRTNGNPVNIFARPERQGFTDKLQRFPVLDDICVITQGCKPFQVGKGKPKQTRKIVTEKPFVSERKIDKTFRPLLRGSLIQKYQTIWNKNSWISFGDWLAEPRYSAHFDSPAKIVIRQTGDSLVATLDREQFIVRDNLYTIVPNDRQCDLRFILAVLNSRLLNWFYQNVVNPERGEALAQVKRGHIAQLPIVSVDLSKARDKSRRDEVVRLVEEMLAAKKEMAKALMDTDKDFWAHKCADLDAKIDRLVYDLYGLTEAEIAIVEGSATK